MKKLRISIRLKMLIVISSILLLTMGTYLYLATSLFTRDKLAYVYDLNSSLVETLSEQTRANLNVVLNHDIAEARNAYKLLVFTRVAEPIASYN